MIRWLPLLLLPSTLAAGNAPNGLLKQDSAWKRYVAADSGYCITYPKHWMRQQVIDGLAFSSGVRRYSMPVGEMDITATSTSDDPMHFLEAHLAGVKKFQRAATVEVLDRRQTTLSGEPALFTKDSYRDALEKSDWVEELVLARHKNVLYRLEMVCRANHVARFEAMFTRFVHSFQLDCNAKH